MLLCVLGESTLYRHQRDGVEVACVVYLCSLHCNVFVAVGKFLSNNGSGVVSVLALINEVTLHWVWLLLGLVTVFGGHTTSV